LPLYGHPTGHPPRRRQSGAKREQQQRAEVTLERPSTCSKAQAADFAFVEAEMMSNLVAHRAGDQRAQ